MRRQPKAWWVQVHDSAARLTEALRTGHRYDPGTPAEQILLFIAIDRGWLDVAQDTIPIDPELSEQFDHLPVGGTKEDIDDEHDPLADFEWGSVIDTVLLDSDVALMPTVGTSRAGRSQSRCCSRSLT